ncbi:MAG: 16S rRNA (guanine(527)-N(7))-methyltransferase RsmG [Halofilum sp. (in: g-proteobacteria)]
MTATEPLAAGLQALGQSLPDDRYDRLLAYRDELARWGRVHNLTSVLDPERMVPVHLLDSLALAPLLRGERIADIGSGGGLPGLPLAIADPDLAMTLVESRTKRALFLEHVVRTLGLGNVIVERSRVEDVPPGTAFDTLVTRAFGSLAEFCAAAGHLAAPGGCLLAAKGRDPAREIEALASDWTTEVIPLVVPGVDAERHAVRMSRRSAARDTGMDVQETTG